MRRVDRREEKFSKWLSFERCGGGGIDIGGNECNSHNHWASFRLRPRADDRVYDNADYCGCCSRTKLEALFRQPPAIQRLSLSRIACEGDKTNDIKLNT